MRRIAVAAAFLAGLVGPAFAQKAEIEAVNAKWMEFFHPGNFSGIASLHRGCDRVPAGFRYGEGQSRDRRDVENHGGAGQRSESRNPRRQAAWVLRGARDRDLQPEDQGSNAAGFTGKYVVVWEKVEGDWKLAANIWNDGK